MTDEEPIGSNFTPTQVGLGFQNCNPNRPCGVCQGNCDEDEDCEGDLVCIHKNRNFGGTIPGCFGPDTSRTDYCVVSKSLPESLPEPVDPRNLTVFNMFEAPEPSTDPVPIDLDFSFSCFCESLSATGECYDGAGLHIATCFNSLNETSALCRLPFQAANDTSVIDCLINTTGPASPELISPVVLLIVGGIVGCCYLSTICLTTLLSGFVCLKLLVSDCIPLKCSMSKIVDKHVDRIRQSEDDYEREIAGLRFVDQDAQTRVTEQHHILGNFALIYQVIGNLGAQTLLLGCFIVGYQTTLYVIALLHILTLILSVVGIWAAVQNMLVLEELERIHEVEGNEEDQVGAVEGDEQIAEDAPLLPSEINENHDEIGGKEEDQVGAVEGDEKDKAGAVEGNEEDQAGAVEGDEEVQAGAVEGDEDDQAVAIEGDEEDQVVAVEDNEKDQVDAEEGKGGNWAVEVTAINSYNDITNAVSKAMLLFLAQAILLGMYIGAIILEERPTFADYRQYVYYFLGALMQSAYTFSRDDPNEFHTTQLGYWKKVFREAKDRKVRFKEKSHFAYRKIPVGSLWIRVFMSTAVNSTGKALLFILLPLRLSHSGEKESLSEDMFFFLGSVVSAYYIINLADIKGKKIKLLRKEHCDD